MLETISLGIVAGAFTDAYFIWMSEDMILEKWGEKVQSLGFFGKPIGGCFYCTTVWVAFMLLLLNAIGLYLLIKIITVVALSHATIKILNK